MASITLKGRTIPLLYTVYEMKLVQEEIAPLSRAMSLLLGRNPDDPNDMSMYAGAEHISTAAKVIRILGNAGLEEAGLEPDLTFKGILRAMKPADLPGAVRACLDAMEEGMTSEIPEEQPEGPVDVTLEEMKKKDGKES